MAWHGMAWYGMSAVQRPPRGGNAGMEWEELESTHSKSVDWLTEIGAGFLQICVNGRIDGRHGHRQLGRKVAVCLTSYR
jgi:hypothetical protein